MSEETIDLENLVHRARHGGVIKRMVKLTEDRKAHEGFMCNLHARLIDSLDQPQQDAVIDITLGFEGATRGMGMKISSYSQRMDVGLSNDDKLQDLVKLYFKWATELQREKLSHAMAMDVIGYGKPLRDIDRDRGLRKETAKRNLIKCLDIYCKLRGWKR